MNLARTFGKDPSSRRKTWGAGSRYESPQVRIAFNFPICLLSLPTFGPLLVAR